MRGLVLSLMVIAAIASFGFAAANMKNVNNQKTAVNEGFENAEFSAFTSAVCEYKGDFVQCKDEVFVNCSGYVSKADDDAECNGIRLDLPKAAGFAVFEKGWKDPRN